MGAMFQLQTPRKGDVCAGLDPVRPVHAYFRPAFLRSYRDGGLEA